jgi:tripartite-type tricarboxylate transporter receptor subunit TctC
MKIAKPGRLAGVLMAALFASNVAIADSAEDFYRGKVLNMTISAGPGNGVDTNARLVGKYLTSYIPGKPTIITRNMPGAGHVIAANYVYNEAPKDGTSLLATLGNIMPYQIMDGRGVRYDASKFIWLGSSESDNSLIFTWKTSGITSLMQAKDTPVTMGATGAGSTTYNYPLLLNKLFGTQFKIVSGYKSDNEINFALEKGEVQGRAGLFYNVLNGIHPDWVAEHKINLLVQIGLRPQEELKDVPLLLSFAQTEEQRQILTLYIGGYTVGRPLITTPGVPADRVAALRKAFDQTMQDREFLAEAEKRNITISVMSGEDVQQIATEYFSAPPAVVEKAKKLLAQ